MTGLVENVSWKSRLISCACHSSSCMVLDLFFFLLLFFFRSYFDVNQFFLLDTSHKDSVFAYRFSIATRKAESIAKIQGTSK